MSNQDGLLELPNGAWALIIIALLAAVSYVAFMVNRRVLPLLLFHNAIWASTLALVGSDLIRYATASTQAWLILLCGVIFFNVGAIVASIQSDRGLPFIRSVEMNHSPIQPLLTRVSFLVIASLYLLGVGLYLTNIELRFGLETLLTDPVRIRADADSYLASTPLVGRIFLYLGPLVFVSLGYKHSMDRPFPLVGRIGGMVLVAATMLSMLQRTNLFLSVLLLVAIVVSSRTGIGGFGRTAPRTVDTRFWHRPRMQLLVALVSAGLVMLAAFQLIGGALNKNAQQALSTDVVSTQLRDSGLTSLFTYYTVGPVAFLQLADSENDKWPPAERPRQLVGDYNPQTWGSATFAPLLKAVPGVRQWDTIQPFIDVGGGMVTNVYTWIEPLYRDYRAVGVVGGMLLLGWVTSALHLRRFNSTRVFWIQGALLSMIFLAGFVSKVNDNLFLGGLIAILILSMRPTSWRRKPGSESAAPLARIGRLS